ncbi:MAG: hypothetical protein ACFFFD_06695, partial [Promethearchaeota archaeon]
MARKKKSEQTETVQETLGDFVEPKKKPAKKSSKKPTTKESTKKSAKEAVKPQAKKTAAKKKPAKKPAEKPAEKSAPETVDTDTGPSLKVLPGVGQKLEEKLIVANYDTVDKISRARSTTMAKKVDGLSLPGAKKLIAAAKEVVKGGPPPAPDLEPPTDAGETDAEDIDASPEARIKLTDLPGVGE